MELQIFKTSIFLHLVLRRNPILKLRSQPFTVMLILKANHLECYK